ncbi:MAG: hypothetical protein H7263_05675 [Candidatus Sericytochromatia bacterium]|nr:hypothetical protein [Candidatus Sericytochromatia bacterium]
MNLKNYAVSAILSATMVATPLSMVAMASEKSKPVQVALLGMGHHNGVKKHHKMRNAALLVGGGLVARHYYKKHKMNKAIRKQMNH